MRPPLCMSAVLHPPYQLDILLRIREADASCALAPVERPSEHAFVALFSTIQQLSKFVGNHPLRAMLQNATSSRRILSKILVRTVKRRAFVFGVVCPAVPTRGRSGRIVIASIEVRRTLGVVSGCHRSCSLAVLSEACLQRGPRRLGRTQSDQHRDG